MFRAPYTLARIVSLLLLMVDILIVCVRIGSGSQPLQPRVYASSSIPNFSHIFQITLENTSYFHLIGSSDAPYLNSLLPKGGLATQFYAFTHYSLPNYFVLTAGQTSTSSYVLNDCAGTTADCTQNYVSLPEEIEASGRTWKAYFQSMPSACDVNSAWPYTPHYNPFVYYTRLLNSGDCTKYVVPDTQFYSDLANHTLPNYIWISPDLCHDGHLSTGSGNTCPNGGPYSTFPQGIGQADSWLSANIPQILASPEYQNGGLLIITWDEGDQGGNGYSEDSSGCCGVANGGHVATLLLSPSITPGIQGSVPETFYSLLRTIESSWSLAPLANEANFNPMSEFFTASTPAPTPPPTPTPTPTPTPAPSSGPTTTSSSGSSPSVSHPAPSASTNTSSVPAQKPHSASPSSTSHPASQTGRTTHAGAPILLARLVADARVTISNRLVIVAGVVIFVIAGVGGVLLRRRTHAHSGPPPDPTLGITVG